MKVEAMDEGKKEQGEKRFPAKRKLPPSGPDALVLDLPAKGNAKTTVSFFVRASSDSRDLRVIFSDKEGKEVPFKYGLETKTDDGEPVSYYLPQFGVYDSKREFRLDIPRDDRKLMLERGDDGNLTVWIEGQDISKAKKESDPERDYIIKYMLGEKTVGYTIKDFLMNVNLAFYNVRFQLQA